MTAPWRRGQAPLVELPVAVTPWAADCLRSGPTLLVAPAFLRQRLLAAMGSRTLFNFELHGIDFADADKDGIPGELVQRQPDLRVSNRRQARAPRRDARRALAHGRFCHPCDCGGGGAASRLVACFQDGRRSQATARPRPADHVGDRRASRRAERADRGARAARRRIAVALRSPSAVEVDGRCHIRLARTAWGEQGLTRYSVVEPGPRRER